MFDLKIITKQFFRNPLAAWVKSLSIYFTRIFLKLNIFSTIASSEEAALPTLWDVDPAMLSFRFTCCKLFSYLLSKFLNLFKQKIR
jgi:hypothetical protein